jgi:hypothetical protein
MSEEIEIVPRLCRCRHARLLKLGRSIGSQVGTSVTTSERNRHARIDSKAILMFAGKETSVPSQRVDRKRRDSEEIVNRL